MKNTKFRIILLRIMKFFRIIRTDKKSVIKAYMNRKSHK